MLNLGLVLFYGLTGIGTVAGTVLYAQAPTPVPVTPEAPFGGYGSNIAGAIFAVGSVLIGLFGMAYQSWLKFRKEEILLNNDSEKAKREKVEEDLRKLIAEVATTHARHQEQVADLNKRLDDKMTVIGMQNLEIGRLSGQLMMRDAWVTDREETIAEMAKRILERSGHLTPTPHGPTDSTSITVPQTTGGQP